MLIPLLQGPILINSADEFVGFTTSKEGVRSTSRLLALNGVQKEMIRSILQRGSDIDDLASSCQEAWHRQPDRLRSAIRGFVEGSGLFRIGEWDAPGPVDVLILDRGWQGVYQHGIDLWHLLNQKCRAVLAAPCEPPYGFDSSLSNLLLTPERFGDEADPTIVFASIARTLIKQLKPKLLFISHRAVMPYVFDLIRTVPTIVHGDHYFDEALGIGKFMATGVDASDPLPLLQDILYADTIAGGPPTLSKTLASYWAAENASELWFYTDEQLHLAEKTHGVASDKLKAVLPLIDANYFCPTESDGQERVILFSTTNQGPAMRHKGLDPLLAALPDLPDNARLRVVVHNLADLPPEVSNWGGQIETLERVDKKKDMLNIYRQARIYCRLSIDDTSPVSVLEAMVTGVPVMVSPIIAKNIPAIVDSYNGFVVDPGDHETIVAKLRMILEDRDLRMKMGQRARQAASRYSFQSNEWMFDQYLQPQTEEAPATYA